MQVPLGLEPFPPINDHDVETRGGSGKRSLHPRQEMKAEQGVHSASASEFSEDCALTSLHASLQQAD
eukprot:1162522-Amphidinium_carterae.1